MEQGENWRVDEKKKETNIIPLIQALLYFESHFETGFIQFFWIGQWPTQFTTPWKWRAAVESERIRRI